MSDLYLFLALLLMLTLLAGLWRVVKGPTAADRMTAAQLFGTTGVAMLMILTKGLAMPVLRDVALVFALLAAVTLIGFLRHYWHPEEDKHV